MEPETMPWKYGTEDTVAIERSPERVGELLALLAGQLERQRESGRSFFVGEYLTALDLYWACFSNMVAPLPPEQSAMPDWIRRLYEDLGGTPRPPAGLIAHRDRIFREFLPLPQDF